MNRTGRIGWMVLTSVLLVAPSAFLWGQAAQPKPTAEDKSQLAEAEELNQQAIGLNRAGRYRDAVAPATRALEIRTRILGPNHLETATSLNNLASFYESLSEYARAEPLYTRALNVWEKQLGPEHPNTATTLNNLAGLYVSMADFPKAESHYTRALKIRQQTLEPGHPDIAQSLNNLGGLYRNLGDYARAEPLYREALKIRENSLGPEHPGTAMSLNSLGLLYVSLGDYAQAEPLHTRALTIRESVLGPDHPHTATSLNNLAGLHRGRGDYALAEPLLQRALKIKEEALGPEHPETAEGLNNLGWLYENMGDYAKAEPLYARALRIWERRLGADHPDTALGLNNLASLYRRIGEYRKAEPLYLRAQQIWEKSPGPDHPATATGLNNLAGLYDKMGEGAKAVPLHLRALKIREQALGLDHSDTAASLNNLGMLYEDLGDPAQAESYYARALKILKKALGPDHPVTADGLHNLGLLHLAKGDHAQAEPLSRQAVEVTLQGLENTALVQSERQQLAMAESMRRHLDGYLQIAVAAKTYDSTAYRFVLASKASILTRQQVQRAMADDRKLAAKFAELQQTTIRLATLALQTPPPLQHAAWQRQITEWSTAKESLERELSQASAPFRAARHRATADEVQAALLADTALVDFAEYYAHIPANKQAGTPVQGQQRLAAFVLSKNGPVKLLDLGSAAPLAEAIANWRAGPFGASADARKAAQLLRARIWQPLEQYLVGAKMVLISPDGELSKFPLAALPGRAPGTFLIEDYSLAIVPAPRGLVGADEALPAASPALGLLAVGNVDYQRQAAPARLTATTPSSQRAATGRDALQFSPLPGAAAELLAVGSAYVKAHAQDKPRRLAGSEATEGAFREAAPRHRFLHLATHGFFAPPTVRSALARDRSSSQERLISDQSLVGHHPDLLSGLALAGANAPPAEGDDGILTAAEVRTLDLRRVELATLSACETGLGQTAGGEGLLGLQRAFQAAGAKSVVASLWKVDDAATQMLMTEFYTNLWERKLPPIEALRRAQLKMLLAYQPSAGKLRAGFEDQALDDAALAAARARLKLGETRTPPFYWAAFVLSGRIP